MSNKIINIILYITAVVALAVVVVFFIKLGSIEPADKGKTDTASTDTENIDELSNLTGKQETSPGPATDTQDTTGTPTVSEDPATQAVTPDPATPTDTDNPSSAVTPTDTPITSDLTVTPDPTVAPDEKGSKVTVDVSKIDPAKPIVALTFDDGPSANTASILETLNEYGAHATFFMVGENVTAHPDRVKMVYDAGCEVGNHTVNHKNLNNLTKKEIKKEIEDNQADINAALGVTISCLVRPPYGNVNDNVREACKHPMINWSVDTLDWKSRNADSVFEEVKKSTKDGSIILMHDLYGSTAEAVKKVVPWLVEQGYQICSVSEMFAARGVTLENGHVYNSVMNAQKYLDSLNSET
ncbi:MAG: polysaccharide deacetylase family protein [Lachnospiraceae bacterium]|nr:polysaccharide deacetylase family protein [Lachnospiraceae bacterium]